MAADGTIAVGDFLGITVYDSTGSRISETATEIRNDLFALEQDVAVIQSAPAIAVDNTTGEILWSENRLFEE